MPDTNTVRENRIALIRALESGEYAKTVGFLVEVNRETPDGYAYCCIGVQRRIAPNNAIVESPYRLFNEDVDVDNKVQTYLIAMNDGDAAYVNDDKESRHTMAVREFPFIARFLRKIWRLTDVPTAP